MKKKESRVFADYASSAPILKEACLAFHKAEAYMANPSSVHKEGRAARAILEDARSRIARFFNVTSDEIIGTASGTESNTLALSGVIEAAAMRFGYGRVHVVTSTIEHPSVKELFAWYERKGVSVSFVSPRSDGLLDPKDFLSVITAETVLVSVQHVNSEIGVIQPIADIARAVKSKGTALIHVDACQSVPWLPVHADTMRADFISADSTKVGGARGVGVLVLRKTVKSFSTIMRGGGQEHGVRGGTENVPGMVSFAAALEVIERRRSVVHTQVCLLRDELLKQILKLVPEAVVNGSLKKRTPNNINISVAGASSELVVAKLDVLGVAASTGTACAVGEEVSATVSALYPDAPLRSKGAVRLTLCPDVTKSDIQKIAKAYTEAISYALRSRG